MSKIVVRLNPDVQPSGSDLAIVNAARRSFNTRSDWQWSQGGTGPFELKDKDKRLLEFLARGMTADDFVEFSEDTYFKEGDFSEFIKKLWQWRNTPTHDTPFDHCHISFEVKAPIFARAQLVKHEYLVMSEFSRRYISDEIEFFMPETWRGVPENKKQGSVEYPLGPNGERTEPVEWLGVDVGTHEFYQTALERYNWMVEIGIAPEQARMVLPQSTMTEWTWSGSLGAFCKMCRLRLHPDAQYEARLVAQEVYEYLKEYYPVGAKALVEGV